MARSHSFDGEIKYVSDESGKLSDSQEEALSRMRERRLAQIASQHEWLRTLRPVELLKRLRDETTEAITAEFPGFLEIRKRIVDKYKADLDKLKPDTAAIFDDLDIYAGPGDPVPSLPSTSVGAFLRSGTTFFSSFGEIITGFNPNDKTNRIWGHIHWTGDNLLTGSAGFIEDFVLSPNSFPPTSQTKCLVRTELQSNGAVCGFTGLYHPVWHADDKVCKCQIIRAMRIFPDVPLPLNIQLAMDAERFEVPLLELENEYPVGQNSFMMTGAWVPILSFDLSTFGTSLAKLAASGTSLLLQVEVRFNVQLEGDADIWFRGFSGNAQQSVPSLQNSNRFRILPMSLETTS
jgi:hypothetical protein